MTTKEINRLARLLFLIDFQQSGTKAELKERNALNAKATQSEFNRAYDIAERKDYEGVKE